MLQSNVFLYIPENSATTNGRRGNIGETSPRDPNNNSNKQTTNNNKPAAANDSKNNSHTQEARDDQLIAIIIGVVAALLIILATIVVFCILRNRRRNKDRKLSKELKHNHDERVTLSLNQLRELTIKSSNGTLYNNLGQDDISDVERQCLVANLINGGKMGGGGGVNGNMYQEEFEAVIQTRKLPELPALKIPDSGTGRHTIQSFVLHW